MPLEVINDKASNDAAVALSTSTPSTTLIVIYVISSANPVCERTTPKIEALSERFSKSDSKTEVKFYRMELDKNTQPMIKFSVQNTPIFIMMKGKWCTTILGADVRRMEKEIEEHL